MLPKVSSRIDASVLERSGLTLDYGKLLTIYGD